eukprot:3318792-Karenia_brevis.AAC.1
MGVAAEESVSTVHSEWKKYLEHVYPHLLHVVRIFLGCCMAEGRNDKDDNLDESAPGREIKFSWDMES